MGYYFFSIEHCYQISANSGKSCKNLLAFFPCFLVVGVNQITQEYNHCQRMAGFQIYEIELNERHLYKTETFRSISSRHKNIFALACYYVGNEKKAKNSAESIRCDCQNEIRPNHVQTIIILRRNRETK